MAFLLSQYYVGFASFFTILTRDFQWVWQIYDTMTDKCYAQEQEKGERKKEKKPRTTLQAISYYLSDSIYDHCEQRQP